MAPDSVLTVTGVKPRTGAAKVFEFTMEPGQTNTVWTTVGWPNNTPDIFVSVLVRPAYPPGHLGHKYHRHEILRSAVGRDESDAAARPRFTFEVEHTGTGTHTNIVEVIIFWQEISPPGAIRPHV